MVGRLVAGCCMYVALYKNQHRSFVESDAPPVSLQGGAACVGREGPTSPEELYTRVYICVQFFWVPPMYQNQSTAEYVVYCMHAPESRNTCPVPGGIEFIDTYVTLCLVQSTL